MHIMLRIALPAEIGSCILLQDIPIVSSSSQYFSTSRAILRVETFRSRLVRSLRRVEKYCEDDETRGYFLLLYHTFQNDVIPCVIRDFVSVKFPSLSCAVQDLELLVVPRHAYL